jgi:hypothetical protein
MIKLYCTDCLLCVTHAALLCLVAPYLSPFLSTCTVQFSGCLLVLFGLNLGFYDYILYCTFSRCLLAGRSLQKGYVPETVTVTVTYCLLCVTHAALLCLVAPYLSPILSVCAL